MIKSSNVCEIEISKGAENKTEIIFEDITAHTFLKLMKNFRTECKSTNIPKLDIYKENYMWNYTPEKS